MATVYKFTSWWGGQEGSLLLWSWLLSSYSAVVVFRNRRKFRDMMPYVTAVLMTTQTFFLILIAFVAKPFQVLMAGKLIVDVGDGQGLNPLLQYWTMVIHPPMLYLGYVGFVVPFAFAIASLITKQPGDAGFIPRAAGRWSRGCSRPPEFCSAQDGLMRSSDGAVTGAGTRWRTPRFCPGSRRRRSCIR